MKSFLVVFVLLACCLAGNAIPQPKQNIVETLIEESDSTISFEFSPSLKKDFIPEVQQKPAPQPTTNNVVRPRAAETVTMPERKTPTRTNGYRIQIFSDGRNQATLQSRARARAKQILSRFPKYNHQVYSFSRVPNYYTRIGNFATRSEANAALQELRRAFPALAGEMRVVSSEVIIMK
ncbi:MAG: SPOR domain-containing protein [Prevotella sp.]|nr:SPOR domain-containing protein [Prevotella sp.]MCM1075651.1 SPOR domain-containing protein [Ruminococcus sp.]